VQYQGGTNSKYYDSNVSYSSIFQLKNYKANRQLQEELVKLAENALSEYEIEKQ
jgi:hypothetical protein